MSYGRNYYAGTDYGECGAESLDAQAQLAMHVDCQREGHRGADERRRGITAAGVAPGHTPPYTGRLNTDFQAGVWVGMMRAALECENRSLGKTGSNFAYAIRMLAQHERMKVEAMMKEGKLI